MSTNPNQVTPAIDLLQQAGWKVTVAAHPISLNEGRMKADYASLPHDYTNFLEQIQECTNQDATAWFVSISDFNGQSNTAFTWDEFEQQSIEAADGDEDILKYVEDFWNQHLPIIMSVKDGCAYIAIYLHHDHYGRIVYGTEPEYEEATSICESFGELCSVIAFLDSTLYIAGTLFTESENYVNSKLCQLEVAASFRPSLRPKSCFPYSPGKKARRSCVVSMSCPRPCWHSGRKPRTPTPPLPSPVPINTSPDQRTEEAIRLTEMERLVGRLTWENDALKRGRLSCRTACRTVCRAAPGRRAEEANRD